MITDSSSPRLNPSDETIKAGQVTIRFLVTDKDSNGSVAVFEFTVGAHRRAADGSRALTRPLRGDHLRSRRGDHFTVDGVPIDIGPGQALCIPRGASHRYDIHGSAEVKGFCAVTPAHLGPEFFREVAAIYAAASAGPPDRVKLMDLMRRQRNHAVPCAASSVGIQEGYAPHQEMRRRRTFKATSRYSADLEDCDVRAAAISTLYPARCPPCHRTALNRREG